MRYTLPELTATRWIDFKGSGRTQPALIGCDLPDGGEIECVVKLGGHRESAPHQPVCELVAALLAKELDLPVAEPVLVEITPEFARQAIPSALPAAKARCEQAIGWAFATRHLPAGFSTIPIGKSPPRALLTTLAELYSFDGLIHNADRMPINPNCLVKSSDLRFFDHDQAFGFLLDIFGAPKVDDPESYAFLRRHLARPFLRHDRAQFARLEGAWEAIDDRALARLGDAVPGSWSGKTKYLPGIHAHLKAVRAKLASAFDAITLTLPIS
jgi:hypothetical protein